VPFKGPQCDAGDPSSSFPPSFLLSHRLVFFLTENPTFTCALSNQTARARTFFFLRPTAFFPLGEASSIFYFPSPLLRLPLSLHDGLSGGDSVVFSSCQAVFVPSGFFSSLFGAIFLAIFSRLPRQIGHVLHSAVEVFFWLLLK